MKPWRLTQIAQDSLTDIALWTWDNFGPRQMARYEAEIIERCTAIAEQRVISLDCSLLAGEAEGSGLKFTRAGEHFIVYLDTDDEIIIVDFLHSQTNLPDRIASLRQK